MAENIQEQICFICGSTYAKLVQAKVNSNWMVHCECARCGKYNIELRLSSEQPWRDVRHLVSAWVRRENKANLIPNIDSESTGFTIYNPEWWINRFISMGFPDTTIEKLDTLLLAYAKSIDYAYGKQFSFGYPHFIADIAAKSQEEVDGLNELLNELGYIDSRFPKITANGWLRIDELRKISLDSNQAFVAMWFDKSTEKFRDAISVAITNCGYKPVIIDQQEYNDFIMNQVISSIRQSKLLVADFTSRPENEKEGKVSNGVRGGVYWEAGLAYGLGIPVIHTCEDNEDSKKRIHFDVNQYNTIFWKTEELGTDIRPLEQNNPNPNFAEKLAARILATVGKGTYIKD